MTTLVEDIVSETSRPLSQVWSRLSGVGVGITDATFVKFLTEVFGRGGMQNLQVYFASNEPIELRVLKKIDEKVQTYLSVGDTLYSQDPGVDILKTQNRKVQRAFNSAVITYDAKTIFPETVYKFAYMEVGDDMTKLIFHEKGAPIVPFIKMVRRIYRQMNRKEKAVMVIGGSGIPFRVIKKIPFIPPSKVWEAWQQQIEPQLLSKKTYDHVLFFGAPGSGKTAFCRWVATQYPKWKFIFAPPQTFMELGRLTSTFKEARQYAPAVIVFEDIDLIGRHRGEMGESFSPVTGELLNQLDGVEPRDNILCIASTNNPAGLDPAVRRHGRFGIKMDLTYTPEEKLRVLRGYYNVPLSDEEVTSYLRKVEIPVNIKMIAKLSEIYHEHLKLKLTATRFGEIVDEITKDKSATVLRGDADDEDADNEEATATLEDSNDDQDSTDPIVK